MTITAPLDQADIRGRLHYFPMETATAAMVTDQMSNIAQKAGHLARTGSKDVTVTSDPAVSVSPKQTAGAITAEVESV